MKRRVRKIANFFAFNLLFFAPYLNFIHKDKAPVSFAGETATQQNTAAFSGSTVVDNPQDNKEPAKTQAADPKSAEGTAALKLSVN